MIRLSGCQGACLKVNKKKQVKHGLGADRCFFKTMLTV
jgi:hypothetical protein